MASLRIRLPGILPAAAWRSPTVRLVCSVPPLWWRRGRPRTTHRSYAEVELLSRLAELLMPQEPIGELFRDFPVKKSQVWGSPWLRPDLTAFGVLKHAHAALFIEYDGFFRHSAVQGQAMDERKTIALLGHAPPNSYVLRIGHVTRDLSRAENAAHAVVNVWRAEHEPSLMKVVQQTGRALLCSFEHVLEREVCERLSRLVIAEAKHDFLIASSFARQAVLTRPPSHGKLMLWGIDELLTYHYLVSEYFMVAPADVTHDSFFKLSKQGQADLVWKGLFMDRSPISEACQGVITTLQRLGLGALLAKRDLPAIREWFAAQNLEEHVEKIFRLARVRYA
ncbi:MTERFD1, partial [Symbiodinium microadriaticum]